MNLAKVISLLAFLSIFSPGIQARDVAPYGKFVGDVEAKWLAENGESRLMELLKEFSYIDPTGKKWTTPKGWKVDGASIPRGLWTIVGSPFTGNYRRASVIHDYYCDRKDEPWEDVHKMFYWASRADGVSELGAKILYAGVYAGGPRWKVVHYSTHSSSMSMAGVAAPTADYVKVIPWQAFIQDEKMKEIQQWIERENPSLEEIKRRTSAHILQQEPDSRVHLDSSAGCDTDCDDKCRVRMGSPAVDFIAPNCHDLCKMEKAFVCSLDKAESRVKSD